MDTEDWLYCPACGGKTRDRVRRDTVLKKFPLYCPKCKRKILIDVKNMQVSVIKVPVA